MCALALLAQPRANRLRRAREVAQPRLLVDDVLVQAGGRGAIDEGQTLDICCQATKATSVFAKRMGAIMSAPKCSALATLPSARARLMR
eukprot:5660088-Alexandrium_andersonii.AAC.1